MGHTIYRSIFMLAVCFCVYGLALAQQETTEPTSANTPTATTVPDTLTPIASIQETVTVFITETATVNLEVTETATATPTLTATATIEPETTEAATNTSIPAITATVTPEPEATDVATATATPTLTATATIEPEATEAATDTVTPDLTGTSPALIVISGYAHYQRHLPDDGGIVITLLDPNRNPLGSAMTSSEGRYALQVPSQTFYWVVAKAPNYRQLEMEYSSIEHPPEIQLAGGDLNGDNCIDTADITLLATHFEQPGATATDIDGNGLTDAADLAILSGNFDGDCDVTPSVTPIAENTMGLTSEPTITTVLTATSTLETTITDTKVTGTIETPPPFSTTPAKGG